MISFKALDANGELINSKMKPFTYPAGEASIKLEERRSFENHEIALVQPESKTINNDLLSLSMWGGVLSRNSPTTTCSIVIPYVPAGREDRGEVFGLGVYTAYLSNVVDSADVVVFDTHSKLTHEHLSRHGLNLMEYKSSDLVHQRRYAFEGYDYVIAPDEGATERAQSVADVLGIPVVQFKKKRDFDTGKILGFEAPIDIDLGAKFLVVDDICDGGGTFLGLVEDTGLTRGFVDLYVSHGVFSKGTEELKKKFGRIITTNSYLSDSVRNGEVDVLDVIRPMIDLIK